MLTIKAPIQTKINTPMLSVGEDFNQRIIGNYELFDLSITGEDFLHLMTQPPEIFLMGDEGITNIYGETNINENNARKIEVVNNFLNRILLSDTVGFTYQDRVFITDVLHKMGITQTASFMKRVTNIISEQQDFSRQLSAYWNYSSEMKSLVEEYISTTDRSTTQVDESRSENTRILHQDIFKRLQTGALYQILSNFYQEEKGVSTITQKELLLSEQKETAEKLLLQALINEVRGEELPLIYKNENYYEEEAAMPTGSEEEAKQSITAATLLSLIRSVVVSRREESFTYPGQWYSITENIHHSQENTIQRITENLHRNMELLSEGDLYITNIAGNADITYQGDLYRQDIDASSGDMIHISSETSEESFFEGERSGDVNVTSVTNEIIRKTDTTIEPADIINVSSETSVAEGDTYNEEQILRSTREGNVDVRSVYETNIQSIDQIIEASNAGRQPEEPVVIFEEPEESAEMVVAQEKEEPQLPPEIVQNIEENNIQMRNTYENNLQALSESYEASIPRISKAEREKAQREALKHPEVFMQEFMVEKARSEQRRREFDEKRQQLALTQSPDAFTMIQQFLEHPEIIPPGVQVSRNDIGSLIYDNRQVENSYKQIERRHNISEATEHEIIEQDLERLRSTEIVRGRTTEEHVRQIENLSLVHKTEETGIDEEILEAITRQRQTNKEVREVHTTQETHVNDERVINTVIDQRLTEQERRLDDLIREGMTRQMNTISDKVYRQIEKRLNNERSRRGV